MSNAPKKEVTEELEVIEVAKTAKVTFTKPSGRYSRGDTGTFSVDQCASYVKRKVAVAGDKLPVVKKED